MESVIKIEGLEIKVDMTQEQIFELLKLVTGAAGVKPAVPENTVSAKIEVPAAEPLKIEHFESETEHDSQKMSNYEEKESIFPKKPYTFRPGSRNEHLFGDRIIPRAQSQRPESRNEEGYSGFLAIKCECCGELRGFYSKFPITFYKCKSCGGKTNLKDMKPMFLKCECGKSYKYKTNMTDKTFEFPCLDCQTPNDLELNDKKGTYSTL